MLFLLFLLPYARSQNYCELSPQHTLCQHQGVGPACNEGPLSKGVTEDEIERILSVHNEYRAKVARGEEERGRGSGQPEAANMMQMSWDDELARIAQMHADQCKFEHDCTECRKTERFGVGQNLYIYKQSQQTKTENDWNRAINDWYSEVDDFSPLNIEPFKFSSDTGHYTQVVWARSYKVGCGTTTYKDGRWFTSLYVCNYGPNGNFLRGQMYKQGKACSACEGDTQCSSKFPGLCVTSSSTSSQSKNSVSPISSTPISNSIERTTEERIEQNFTCSFDSIDRNCGVKTKGQKWTEKDLFGNKYLEIQLKDGEQSELVFDKKLEAPVGSIACLSFRFKKFPEGELAVLAWPLLGEPGVVRIASNSPDNFTWLKVLVTLRSITTQWSLRFRALATSNEDLTVGLDDISIVSGKCADI